MIKALEDQLDEIRLTADNNKLLPLPGETVSCISGCMSPIPTSGSSDTLSDLDAVGEAKTANEAIKSCVGWGTQS